MARRLHIADSQTGADVQMAGAFWDGFLFFFFLLPPQQSLSHSSQDHSFLPASSIVGHLSFLSQRWSEETGWCFLPSSPPPTGELPPCLGGGNDTVPSPVIHPQRASFGGAEGGSPRKWPTQGHPSHFVREAAVITKSK